MPQLLNPDATPPQTVGTNVNATVANTSLGNLNGTIANTVTGATFSGACTTTIATSIPMTIKRSGTEVPQGWTQIKLRDCEAFNFEVTESPVNGKECFIASLTVSNANARHHLNLFQRLHPAVDYLLCGIAQTEASGVTVSNVIFTNRVDFELFENWFEEYLELFGSRENLYSHRLPPPPTQMNYSHQIPLANHDNLVDACVWFRENCVNNVYMLANRLFFLEDQDAIAYKLRFA